jgi:multidrug efflux system outer membrane protein
MGPNYTRPTVPAPPEFRGTVLDTGQPPTASLVNTRWLDLFDDAQLTEYIQTALDKNYDLRIAVARVLEQRAQAGIVRSELFPTVSASLGLTTARSSQNGQTSFPPNFPIKLEAEYSQIGGGLASWEIDVWGRLRRLTEAARAEYLASEDNRRGVVTTLIASVASAYFQLCELDLELAIAERTVITREDGLRLTTARRDRGVTSSIEVRQAEDLLYTANATIAQIQREIEQTENSLNLLMGRSPGEIVRGKSFDEQRTPSAIPAGMPSSLLERRPDIRAAEENLIAANARIGAAKAAYFPEITLTGFFGTQSRALGELLSGPNKTWNFVANLSQPIFNGGRLRSGVRLSEAAQQEAVAQYEKTIQTAFREVSDALIGYGKTRDQRLVQEQVVRARQETRRLAQLRWQGGLDSYLQVLDAERNLFQGQLDLARLRLGEFLSIVELYRALGGGWES